MCPGKHVVNDGHELHNPLIKVEVLQALEEVGVLPAIRAHHGNLLWLGLGGKDRHFQTERLQQYRLKEKQVTRLSLRFGSTSNLVLLGVAWHGDAGGLDGSQMGTDLIEAESRLQPFLGPVHQHLLKLMRRDDTIQGKGWYM